MVTMATLYQNVPIHLIEVDGKNPRKTFDEADLAELAASIKQVGMVEPLVVRPVNGSGYLLVAGERRLRAAKIAELPELPCVIREYDDRQAREVQLVENLQRKNISGIEEAQGFRELMDGYGYTAEQLADRVGKKPRVIYQRLALIKLPEPVKEAMATGKLTTNHAILIARAPAAHQIELMEHAVDRDISVRDLDQWIKRTITLKLDAAPFDRADAELLASAGSCETCPKRSGNAREMFPEIKSPDVCTDKDCYDEKIVQHVNRALQANKDLVQIQVGYEYWRERPKHVLQRGQFSLIEKKKDRCEHAAPAIIVFGERAGNLAEVCIHPKCKQHKRSSRYERSADDKAKAKAEKRKIDIAREARNRVADAILDAAGWSRSGLLESVAEALWERLGHDAQRLIRKRHPDWDADILPIGDLPEEKLERLLMELSLAWDLMVYGYSDDKGVGEGLRERADACGVDWKAIEKAVTAELSAPKLSAAEKRRVAKCAGQADTEAPPKPKRGKKSAPPVDTFAGIERDTGTEITLRAKPKGPALAEILLVKKPKAKGNGRKAMTEAGWVAAIAVALSGEPKQSEHLYAETEKETPFESTTPALYAAYNRIGELAVGIGGDAQMVREWTARKLMALSV